MPTFRIEAEGTSHEIYMVDAPDEETARDMFNEGLITRPVSQDISGAEIIVIQELQSGSMDPAAHVYDRDPE